MKKYKNMLLSIVIFINTVITLIGAFKHNIWLLLGGFALNIIWIICVDRFLGGWTEPKDEWDWDK